MLQATIFFFLYMVVFFTAVVMVLEGIQGFDWRITPAQRKLLYEWSNVAIMAAISSLMILALLLSVAFFIYSLE